MQVKSVLRIEKCLACFNDEWAKYVSKKINIFICCCFEIETKRNICFTCFIKTL